MSTPGQIHSTGRGGAGNIGEDPNTYTDGDIIREGVAGQSGRAGGADYSAGRGGAGNMVHPSATGGGGGPGALSEEVVPELATRAGDGYENYHTGRGGQGNVHRDEFGGHSGPQKERHHNGQHAHGAEGLIEKAKHAIGLDRKRGE